MPARNTTPVSPTDANDMINGSLGDGSEESASMLDEKIRAQLGRQLSAYYNDLVNQPIPDTFIELLKQLEKVETAE